MKPKFVFKIGEQRFIYQQKSPKKGPERSQEPRPMSHEDYKRMLTIRDFLPKEDQKRMAAYEKQLRKEAATRTGGEMKALEELSQKDQMENTALSKIRELRGKNAKWPEIVAALEEIFIIPKDELIKTLKESRNDRRTAEEVTRIALSRRTEIAFETSN